MQTGEVGIEIAPVLAAPSLESKVAAQLDALLRRTCQIARALTDAEQAALKLWVGEDSSQARKYFSLSEKYAAFRDFRVDPKGIGLHGMPIPPGEVIRLALLSTHYRDPLDWTAQKLSQARAALDRFYRSLDLPGDRSGEAAVAVPGAARDALEDDLNAPLAIAQLHELAGAINRAANDTERGRLQAQLRAAGTLMGILEGDPAAWLRGASDAEATGIETRIAERARARKERRFADADRIRAELLAEGVVLEDKPDGTTTWRRE